MDNFQSGSQEVLESQSNRTTKIAKRKKANRSLADKKSSAMIDFGKFPEKEGYDHAYPSVRNGIRDKVLHNANHNLAKYDKRIKMEKVSMNNSAFVNFERLRKKSKLRVRLKDLMEITHLPIHLDKDKGIERDDFFRVGGHYKSSMNSKTGKVDPEEKARFKKMAKNLKFKLTDHHRTVLVSNHPSYQRQYKDDRS